MRYWIFMLALLALALVLLVPACKQTGGQAPTNQGGEVQTFSDAQSAAARALETYRKLVTNDNYKELGFESLDEAAAATLGEPRRVFAVKLDQLRAYQAGGDPNRLLTDANRVIYPVAVREQVRSSISVEQKDGKWRAMDFGNAGLAKQIAQASRNLTASNQKPEETPIVVHVLPFNLYFLGHRFEKRLLLTPLGDYSTFNLKSGAPAPADEVFASLASFAKEYNGLPM
jgi:hypothetical protein